MGTMDTTAPPTRPGQGKLGVWDTICIIVGIVIGSTIFETPPTIFESLISPWEGLGVWLAGGVLSLIGALCYAELASTYPKAGGDYVYLTRAFGRPVGFLFGWAQLAVILSGSTAGMAFIFGRYGTRLFQMPEADAAALGLAATVLLCAVNFFGVVLGKWVQDLLAILKIGGMALIAVVGFIWATPDAFAVTDTVRHGAGVGVSLLLVLYAYGGWNDAAFVASDLKEPRSIVKALLLGTAGITVIYLLVNLAYILSLGWENVRRWSPTIAALVMEPLGPAGSVLISLIVMMSALGAMNGLIFTGSRVYASLGSEHRVFALLGYWHPRLQSPIWALLIQAAVTIGMILQVGTATGRDLTDQTLQAVGLPAIPWEQYHGGFLTLFAGTAPAFWIFFLLTGLSFFVLRLKDPTIERPFRLHFPWYPLLPLVFCGMCVFGFWKAITYAGWLSLIGFIPLAVGIPLYLLSGHQAVASAEGEAAP